MAVKNRKNPKSFVAIILLHLTNGLFLWTTFDSPHLTDYFNEKFRMKISFCNHDDDGFSFNLGNNFLGKHEGDFTLKPGSKNYSDKDLSGAPCSANSRVSFTIKIEEY